MTELELTRTPDDRRLYELRGVGTLRLTGLASRAATAEADGRSWRLARHGLTGSVIDATDEAGTVVGEFKGRAVRRGGALRWSDREHELRPDGVLRERYVLAAGERPLATIASKGWGRTPVRITVDDAAALDPGLLLFAAFVVRALAADAQSSGGAPGVA